MLRTLVVIALAFAGIALVATGGRIGPIDLTGMPPLLLASVAVTALVLLGLRHS